MAITINSNFSVGAALPIDDRLVLTKQQMIDINENVMPEVYFAVCSDDGNMYLFNKANEVSAETGKFALFEAGASTQTATMPAASAEMSGSVLQYIGETTDEFTRGYFYSCDYDAETDTYSWSAIDTQVDEVGEGGALEADITPNVTLGGIESGTTLTAGMSVTDILTQLLVKYIGPEAMMTINPSTTLYKLGDSIDNLVITANATKNSEDITAVTFYNGDTVLETVTEGVAEGGSFTHTLAESITSTTTLKVEVTDGTESDTVSATITFINPYYSGVADTNTITDTTGLNEALEKKGNKTISYTASNQYLVFMYPTSYGELTSVLDGNGFENIDSFTQSTLDVSGVSYNVYISNTPITCTNFKYTFKL